MNRAHFEESLLNFQKTLLQVDEFFQALGVNILGIVHLLLKNIDSLHELFLQIVLQDLKMVLCLFHESINVVIYRQYFQTLVHHTKRTIVTLILLSFDRIIVLAALNWGRWHCLASFQLLELFLRRSNPTNGLIPLTTSIIHYLNIKLHFRITWQKVLETIFNRTGRYIVQGLRLLNFCYPCFFHFL